MLRRFSNKQIVNLSKKLGGGGEGDIYTVDGEPSLVAKIYHLGKLSDVGRNKLKEMYRNPPSDPSDSSGHSSIAWPTDLLLRNDSGEQIVGFLMPLVKDMYPVNQYYNPSNRLQIEPKFNYRYLHFAARNLASAFSALHAKGYVIGDVNESNILVAKTSLATLVDTDSFQVKNPNGGFYRCSVGKPEYTPPELQGKHFSEIDRFVEHDLFGLAVLIFQLLMEGTHPFDGAFQGSGDPPPQSKRIAAGHFPYGNKKVPYKPKPLAPSFGILHPELQKLFRRCFEDGHDNPSIRPTAINWLDALDIVATKLATCSVKSQHLYNSHLTDCPWCQRAILKMDFFAPDVPPQISLPHPNSPVPPPTPTGGTIVNSPPPVPSPTPTGGTIVNSPPPVPPPTPTGGTIVNSPPSVPSNTLLKAYNVLSSPISIKTFVTVICLGLSWFFLGGKIAAFYLYIATNWKVISAIIFVGFVTGLIPYIGEFCLLVGSCLLIIGIIKAPFVFFTNIEGLAGCCTYLFAVFLGVALRHGFFNFRK